MKILEQGLADGVFPLARAEVWRDGKSVISAGNAPAETVFDLASLTKVMCTTPLALTTLKLKTTVGELLGDGPSAKVTVEDLLFHRSGLPAFLPFFADAIARWPQLFEDACPAPTRAAARAHVVEAARTTALSGARAAVYSDIGFILLGEMVAKAGGAPLDELCAKVTSAAYRRITAQPTLPPGLAKTGDLRPREPAPGQEGMWRTPTQPTTPGEVDDDNAWAMDGVSGHAGLFGTAHDVAAFGQQVLEGRFGTAWEPDASTPGSTRALGFDTPSATGSSSGTRLSRRSIGHTGFTGTSLWIDLERRLVVALCTNRVALGRANVKIREFRGRFHDAVLETLSL